jgi:hypothetical protein
MLSVTNKPFVLSVVMLSVVMLSVVMLSVVMLNVVAPTTETLKGMPINFSLIFVGKARSTGNELHSGRLQPCLQLLG